MKKGNYPFLILLLLVLFLVYICASNSQYIELLEVNEELLNTLETQRFNSEELILNWESSYKELQSNYAGLLVERDELITKLNDIELPVYEYTEAEIYLLAQCVEAEAGHYEDHKLSQRYVTQVILNRIHSGEFPNSVEGVIYQKVHGIPQFSVAYNGEINREVEPETLANVYSVIVNGTDLPEYVCYFYSDSVTENWVNTLPIYDTIEGTVFAYENKEE